MGDAGGEDGVSVCSWATLRSALVTSWTCLNKSVPVSLQLVFGSWGIHTLFLRFDVSVQGVIVKNCFCDAGGKDYERRSDGGDAGALWSISFANHVKGFDFMSCARFRNIGNRGSIDWLWCTDLPQVLSLLQVPRTSEGVYQVSFGAWPFNNMNRHSVLVLGDAFAEL